MCLLGGVSLDLGMGSYKCTKVFVGQSYIWLFKILELKTLDL